MQMDEWLKTEWAFRLKASEQKKSQKPKQAVYRSDAGEVVAGTDVINFHQWHEQWTI